MNSVQHCIVLNIGLYLQNSQKTRVYFHFEHIGAASVALGKAAATSVFCFETKMQFEELGYCWQARSTCPL